MQGNQPASTSPLKQARPWRPLSQFGQSRQTAGICGEKWLGCGVAVVTSENQHSCTCLTKPQLLSLTLPFQSEPNPGPGPFLYTLILIAFFVTHILRILKPELRLHCNPSVRQHACRHRIRPSDRLAVMSVNLLK
jgi:hypothetical protein